jgi:hypothetical protein
MYTLFSLRHSSSSFPLVACALLLGLFLTGCEDASLGPTLRGSIEGRVLDFRDRSPIEGAGITTSPATGSFLSGQNGSFSLTDLEAGTYSLTARRNGFTANTVAVSVRDGETTPVTILLEADDEATTDRPTLDASIVNWANRSLSPDSTFIDVEYRVRNDGEADISRYEVYVQIDTDADRFFQEVRGDSLRIGQADIGTFSKFIRGNTARSVAIDTVYAEPEML